MKFEVFQYISSVRNFKFQTAKLKNKTKALQVILPKICGITFYTSFKKYFKTNTDFFPRTLECKKCKKINVLWKSHVPPPPPCIAFTCQVSLSQCVSKSTKHCLFHLQWNICWVIKMKANSIKTNNTFLLCASLVWYLQTVTLIFSTNRGAAAIQTNRTAVFKFKYRSNYTQI